MGAINIAFSMDGMYGDGLNLYQYLRSNPWMNSDPLGLRVDPFDMMDEIMDEHVGSIAGFAGAIGAHGAKAAIIAARIATFLPFPGLNIVGELALVAMGEQSMGQAMMAMAIGTLAGGKLGHYLLTKTGLGKRIGGLASSFMKSTMEYISKSAVGRFAASATGWVSRKLAKAVGKGGCAACFTASTLVLTANGAVPIIELEKGHSVLAAPDDGLAESYRNANVGTKIVVGEASLVHLHVVHMDGVEETIDTTDEHPFHVADLAQWTRADQLEIGDQLSTINGTCTLVGVGYSTDRVPVYNISDPWIANILCGATRRLGA